MKSTMLLGVSVGVLLVPAALWQSRAPNPVPLVPASTMVQPTQVISRLPFVISSPGRYVLSGSLAAADRPARGAESGIVIGTDHVELDLDGHLLIGAEGTASGISVRLPEKRDALTDICVRNGTLTGWGGLGVDLRAVQGARLIDLHAVHNGAQRTTMAGIYVGDAALVQGCTALSNSGAGIIAGDGSLLEGCLASRNGLEGFVLDGGASARASSAVSNGRDGFLLNGAGCSLFDCSASINSGHGINALVTASVRACNTSSNGGSGVASGRGSFVGDCVSTNNRGAGVAASGGLSRIEGNHLMLNAAGFDVSGNGNVVVRNTLSDADSAAGLLTDSGPGGMFISDPHAVQLSLAGVGSLRGASGAPGGVVPPLVEDGGALAPWANIAVN